VHSNFHPHHNRTCPPGFGAIPPPPPPFPVATCFFRVLQSRLPPPFLRLYFSPTDTHSRPGPTWRSCLSFFAALKTSPAVFFYFFVPPLLQPSPRQPLFPLRADPPVATPSSYLYRPPSSRPPSSQKSPLTPSEQQHTDPTNIFPSPPATPSALLCALSHLRNRVRVYADVPSSCLLSRFAPQPPLPFLASPPPHDAPATSNTPCHPNTKQPESALTLLL